MEFSLQQLDNDSLAKYCALTTQRLFQKSIYKLYKIILEYGSKMNLKEKVFLFAYQLEFNNLPSPLEYLNSKSFQIGNLEKELFLLMNRGNNWSKQKC